MKIKYKIIIVTLLFAQTNLFGQEGDNKNQVDLGKPAASKEKEKAKELIRTAADLRSGNFQDVLSSFLQLSISDLTGSNKTLNFKSSLFALKVKTDSSLLIDKNYVKQTFARNFQFDFSLKLDSQYKFTGFKSGFTWAIVNKRDSSIFSLANTYIDKLFDSSQTLLQNAFINFQTSLSDKDGKIKDENMDLFKKVKKQIQENLKSNGFAEIQSYPEQFQKFILNQFPHYDGLVKEANNQFNSKLEELRRKPLLTLSLNSSFINNQHTFENGEFQFVYLQGLKTKKTSTEIDARFSGDLKDTMLVVKERRAKGKVSLGINFSLFQGKSQKSFVEFKPYMEYQNILTPLIADEKKSLFTANADLRLRITQNLWLPFTIKYDFSKKNFLGFLNVSFNMDAFKATKS